MNTDEVKPITPDEVITLKRKLMPNYVILGFNSLIAKNWDGKKSSFNQKAVIDEISEFYTVMNDNKKLNIADIYLDVEDIYREIGWIVRYDKPDRGDTYDAFFVFEK